MRLPAYPDLHKHRVNVTRSKHPEFLRAGQQSAQFQRLLIKVYNRVYKTIYARMKRGTLTADEFNRWKAEARHMLDKTRAGEVNEDEFEAWLKQDIRAWGIGRPAAVQRTPKLGEE